MSDEIFFHEETNFDARLNIGDESIVSGVINISNMRPPYFVIDKFTSIKQSIDMNKLLANKCGVLKGETKFGSVLLVNGTYRDQMIQPKYILLAESLMGIDGFNISIPGLYEFFNGPMSFHYRDGCITKKINDSFLNFDFKIENESYHLSIEHWFKSSNSGRLTEIKEDAVIHIARRDGMLNLEKVQLISEMVVMLFSLMTGYKLSIGSILVSKSKNNESYPFYFFAPSDGNVPFQNYQFSFVKIPNSIPIESWERMFNIFFSYDYLADFDKYWSRLINLFSHKGAWEYSVLGYFSVLEVFCVDEVDKDNNFKRGIREFQSNKKNKAQKLVEELQETMASQSILSEKECSIFQSISEKLQSNANSRITVNNVLEYYFKEVLNSSMVSILNFDDGDFALVKKIRNCTAHARPIPENIRNQYQRGVVVTNKIIVLLMYLAFRRIGVSESSFFGFLKSSYHKYINGAELSEFEINLAIDYPYIYKVSQDAVDEIKMLSDPYEVFEFDLSGGLVSIGSANLKTLVLEWMLSNLVKEISVSDFILSSLGSNSEWDVESMPEAFFYCDGENVRQDWPVIFRVRS